MASSYGGGAGTATLKSFIRLRQPSGEHISPHFRRLLLFPHFQIAEPTARGRADPIYHVLSSRRPIWAFRHD